MFGNEAFAEYYFSNDSTRLRQPNAPVVLSKRARNEGDEEEAVIQSMVKRLRVDDDSKPSSPVPLYQQQQQHQFHHQHQHQHQQYSEAAYQAQYTQHLHQQQQQHQQYIHQHHQYPIQPIHPIPQYATVQTYQSNLAVSTDTSLEREQCPLTPQARRQQQFRLQQQQEFHQEQQHSLQVPGDVSEEPPFVSPMNKLLGSLHQQRRVNSWQRQERLSLPSNTQLF
ncbi:hypothetical protein MHU86_8855 [Fragilaria crotonensis]|nr:hypothetical protein MHU86_8855 [Fragilaria crotonensis]